MKRVSSRVVVDLGSEEPNIRKSEGAEDFDLGFTCAGVRGFLREGHTGRAPTKYSRRHQSMMRRVLQRISG